MWCGRKRLVAEESKDGDEFLSDGLAAMEDSFIYRGRPRCALKLNRGQPFYNEDGCLIANCPEGVYEVPPPREDSPPGHPPAPLPLPRGGGGGGAYLQMASSAHVACTCCNAVADVLGGQ